MLTYGSLFSGIEGGGLGFDQTGKFKQIWSVETDEDCNDTRRRHWPDVPQYGDIKNFPPPEGVERPDVIIGGSPCQDLSVAGARAGIHGERSGLFWEMERVIRIIRPRYVVWENVRGAFSSGGGADFRAVLGAFSRLGYDADWTVLRASDFGYPHGRPRVFLVAYRPGARHESAGRGADVREERGGECVSGAGRGELADRSGAGLEERAGESGDVGAECSTAVGGGGELDNGSWGGGCRSQREEGWSGRRRVCETGEQLATAGHGEELANGGDGQFPVEGRRQEERDGVGSGSAIPRCPPGPGLTYNRVGYIIDLFAKEPEKARAIFEAERRETERWAEILEEWPWLAPAVKPGFRGMVDGVPVVLDASRSPRLRALGNAIVSACARWIGEQIILWEERGEK